MKMLVLTYPTNLPLNTIITYLPMIRNSNSLPSAFILFHSQTPLISPNSIPPKLLQYSPLP